MPALPAGGPAEQLKLTVEHRANPSIEGLTLELKAQGEAFALQLVENETPHPEAPSTLSPDQRVEQVLVQATTPLSMRQLRKACRMRMTSVGQALEYLAANGRVRKEHNGFRLVDTDNAFPVSLSPIPPPGNGHGKHPPTDSPPLTRLPGETDSGPAGAQPEEG